MNPIQGFLANDLYTGLARSGHLDSQAQKVSDISRYVPVASMIRRLFPQQNSLKIADFNCASGEAAVGLVSSLKDYEISLDLYDKSAAATSSAKNLFNSKGLSANIDQVKARDLTDEVDPALRYDVGVIGHVHYYLDRMTYEEAIRKRLKECKYLFVCPAYKDERTQWAADGSLANSKKMYSTRLFYLDSNGDIQTDVHYEMLPLSS